MRKRERKWEVVTPDGVRFYDATSEREARKLAREWNAGAGGETAIPWVLAPGRAQRKGVQS